MMADVSEQPAAPAPQPSVVFVLEMLVEAEVTKADGTPRLSLED
jgi:hypothetical protein